MLEEFNKLSKKSGVSVDDLFRASPSVSYVCRVETNAAVPVWVSANLPLVVGHVAEATIGDASWWPAHLHPDDMETVFQGVGGGIAAGGLTHDYRFRFADGSYHWIRDQFRVHRPDDDAGPDAPAYLIGAWTVIDDLKQIEQELIATARQERQANEAKSRFLAAMSHEIRTPMNGVLGMTDILSGAANLTLEQQECIDVIREAGQGLFRFLNDILDLSCIETNDLELDIAGFSVAEFLNSVAAQWKTPVEAGGLGFSIRSDLPDIDIVRTDRGRLDQILSNLIGNAVKFTEQGEIAIQVGVAQRTPGRVELRFEVLDTGIGVAEDRLSAIFDPFTQADNSLARKYQGSGLGLSVSKRLVEMMGGDMGVDSEPDKGSVFWFTVFAETGERPAAEGETGAAAQSDEIPIHSPCFSSVLVAEDNRINQIVLEAMLCTFCDEIDFADNGLSAVEAVQNAAYDLVLMDVQMPEMDGLDATRAIRRLPQPLCDIPIIAVTANAMEGDRQVCLDAGMNDYVTKPVDLKDLLGVISKWTNGAGSGT